MNKLKEYPKEIPCIIVAIIIYCVSVYIVGLGSATLLILTVPISAFAVFAFKYGKPRTYNPVENRMIWVWLVAYMLLVTLTAAGVVPLVNELSNWLWLVIIPLVIVKFSNKATIKETLTMIGLRGSETKKPWKKKTLSMCFVIFPFLILFAYARFGITFENIMESPATLLFFPFMFVLMMLMAGTTEEIFFRGIVQRNIYNATRSQAIAVIISALIFALFHLPFAYFFWDHTQGNLLLSLAGVMTEQFTTGLFLGIVFIRSSNLWTAIILHSLINSVWATATFFTDTPILNISFG